MQTNAKIPSLLLVEDCDDDAFFFKHMLMKSEVTCLYHHVVNGVEAVEFLTNACRSGKQDFPTTMFLDLKMPVLNGFEVLEWMRTQSFPHPIQVIVLSGSEHDDDKKRATQLGAADYLVKPIRVGDFQRILQHVCPPQIGAAA